MSVNKVILVGRLGKDPEVRYATNGSAMANVTLATSENWKDRATGQRQERTEWHSLVFFGRLAEIAGEYLRKGSQVYVEGRIQTRKWQDQTGNDRYTTEIVVNEMTMLGGRAGSGMGGGAGYDNSMPQQGGGQGYNAPQPAAQPQQPAQPAQQPAAAAPRPAAPAAPANNSFDNFDDDIPF